MNRAYPLFFCGAVTASLLACSAESASESTEVSVGVEEGRVDPTCIRGGTSCGPLPTLGGTGSKYTLNDMVLVESGPGKGPSFFCEGAGPEGDGAQYRVLGSTTNKQCWSSKPLQIDGGIPWGFTLLSLYVCPSAYPVNRCDPYGRCTCWEY